MSQQEETAAQADKRMQFEAKMWDEEAQAREHLATAYWLLAAIDAELTRRGQ